MAYVFIGRMDKCQAFGQNISYFQNYFTMEKQSCT